MNKENIFWTGLYLGALLLVTTTFLCLTILDYQDKDIILNFNEQDKSYTEGDCTGIEYWNSGKGFMNDYEVMWAYYANHYDAREINGDGIDKVADLREGKYFNCEDMSNAILCLGKKYDIDCYFYQEIYLTGEEENHQGVKCKVNEEYIKLN